MPSANRALRLPGGGRLRISSLKNWRMRPKLVAVVIGPTVVAVLLALISAIGSWSTLDGYQQSVALLQLDTQVDSLADALQSERDVSIVYVASNRTVDADQVKAARAATDRAVADYRTAAANLDDASSGQLPELLGSVEDAMQGLSFVRSATDDAGLTLGAITGTYGDTIGTLSDLVAYNPGSDSRVAGDIRVLSDFFGLKELTSQIRGVHGGILTVGTFSVGQLQDFTNLLGQQQTLLNSFLAEGSQQQRALYSTTVQGPAISQVQTMQNDSIQAATAPSLPDDPKVWFTTSTHELGLLRQVQTQLLGGIINDVQGLYDSALWKFVLAIASLLLVIGISVLMSVVVARSISTQLRQLRQSATHVATRWLPEVMRRLRRPTVDPFADFSIDRLDAIPKGEIGEVAGAFDSVASACLQLARQQNELRLNTTAAFINLARRNQGCVHGMLRALDEWEKRELNPDNLERLFQLDHLATRMRRTDDSLLVIAGAQTANPRNEPNTLDDVVSAALSEIEQYARVNRMSAGSTMVIGAAVVDLAHLLAELFDNATRFSPPSSKVELSFRAADHGIVVVIRDHGRGMPKEQIEETNKLMAASAEDIISSSMRTMGHLVVARLAAKHSIEVRLQPAPRRGIVVTVHLPRMILAGPPGRLPVAAPRRERTGDTPVPFAAPVAPPEPVRQPAPRHEAPAEYAGFGLTDELPPDTAPVHKTYTLEECLAVRRRLREAPSIGDSGL